nr:hypothetical protein [Caulobacter sp. RHG1]
MKEQLAVWGFYGPRHTHTWNMLVLSHRALERFGADEELTIEVEYHWENFIIRLWLYRARVLALTKLPAIEVEAKAAIRAFDDQFTVDGVRQLKAIRDMIEHFDDYASGIGRGPATRDGELDPWRGLSSDRFERGRFVIERTQAFDAAVKLRSDAKSASEAFHVTCSNLKS